MERITSFKDQELHSLMYSVYYEICNSVRSASLLHTSTIKDNNPFHFEQVVKEANKAITKLIELHSPNDKRRDDFKLINEKELIKKAKEFFAQDIY